jgi:hypothetical protein
VTERVKQILSNNSCRPHPDHVTVIREWPFPPIKRDLQRFLGSINFYRRFIPKTANKLQVILYDLATQVTKRDGPLQWTDDSRAALAATILLDNLKANAQLRLSTDASSIAVGAVIEQKDDDDWLPLGVFSKKLSIY